MKKMLVVLLFLAMNLAVSAHRYYLEDMNSLNGERSFASSSTVFNNGPQYKNPAIAFLFSTICPGLGQMYNDEVGKGFAFLGASVLTASAYYLFSTYNIIFEKDLRENMTWVALVGFATSYIWQLIDAPLTANSKNKKNGYVVSLTPLLLPNNMSQNDQFSITPGLNLSLSF